MDKASFLPSKWTSARPSPTASYNTSPSGGSPSSSSDAWWEPFIARGHLADRLRRAHEPLPQHLYDSLGSATAAAKSASHHYAFPSQSDAGGSSSESPPSSSSSFSRRTARLAAAQEAFAGGRPRYQSMNGVDALYASNKASLPARAAFQNSSEHRHQPRVSNKDERRHSSAFPIAAPPALKRRSAGPYTASVGHGSPLSQTPEISSGSDNEDLSPPASLSAAASKLVNSRASSTTTTTTTTRRMHASQSTVSRSQSTRAGSLTAQEWSELFETRKSKTHSRRVSFDIGAEARAKSDDGLDCDRYQGYRAWGPNGLGIAHNGQGQESSAFYPSHAPAHHATAAESLAASGSQHWFNTTSTSTTCSRRRTRTLSRDYYGVQQHGMFRSGPAGPAMSAPTSPRSSIHLHDDERLRLKRFLAQDKNQQAEQEESQRPGVSLGSRTRAGHPPLPPTRSASAEDVHLPVMRSLQTAQSHIAETTSTALHYSRSLLAVPAPVLRPIFHLTLLWCVSSATLMALATCLLVSYMLTAWDDVGGRSKEVRRWMGVGAGKRDAQKSDDPTEKTSDGARDSAATSDATGWTRQGSSVTSCTMEASRVVLDSLVLGPLSSAVKFPLSVAKSLAPVAVATPSVSRRGSFSGDEDRCSRSDGRSGTGSSSSRPSTSRRRSRRPQPLPPRPPLTSLIPSMLLTILIALSAALIGGWAKRRSASPTGETTPSPPSQTRPSLATASSLQTPDSPSAGIDAFGWERASAAAAMSPSLASDEKRRRRRSSSASSIPQLESCTEHVLSPNIGMDRYSI